VRLLSYYRAALTGPGTVANVQRNATGECHKEGGRWSCWPADVIELDDPPPRRDRELEIFSIVAEHFRHDLTVFWTHSTFFLLIHGALAGVFITIVGPQDPNLDPGLLGPAERASALCGIGFVLAFLWRWVAHRSMLFIRCWREQVIHLAGAVDPHASYLRVEPAAKQPWWYGPTSSAAVVPWFFLLGWLGALVWIVWVA
jgi:hypothetical protein